MTFFTFKESIDNFFKSIKEFFFKNDSNNISNLERIIAVIIIIIVAFILIKLITKLLEKALKLNKGPNIDKSVKTFTVQLIKVLLWVFVAFIVLSILNVDMSSFAGVLSAIMVALGLALQDLIASLASGLILLNQKNFLTGDYVEITNDYGKVEGEVTSINLFFTNLVTFDGQVVIIPNNNVLKANVINYTKEKTRRFAVEVKCAMDTDIDLVKNILFDIANSDNRVSKDKKPLVFLNEISDYSIKFSLKCWVYQEYYWDVYVDYNEIILKAFRENNISVPTSTSININK